MYTENDIHLAWCTGKHTKERKIPSINWQHIGPQICVDAANADKSIVVIVYNIVHYKANGSARNFKLTLRCGKPYLPNEPMPHPLAYPAHYWESGVDELPPAALRYKPADCFSEITIVQPLLDQGVTRNREQQYANLRKNARIRLSPPYGVEYYSGMDESLHLNDVLEWAPIVKVVSLKIQKQFFKPGEILLDDMQP